MVRQHQGHVGPCGCFGPMETLRTQKRGRTDYNETSASWMNGLQAELQRPRGLPDPRLLCERGRTWLWSIVWGAEAGGEGGPTARGFSG